MAFVVWYGRPGVCSEFWDTFETLGGAEKFRSEQAYPDGDILDDPKMPAGQSGRFGEYPETEEDYESFSPEPPTDALIAIWKWLQRGGRDQWGHAPHWMSAALAAFADDNYERGWECLAIGLGTKDSLHGEAREELFRSSRLFEWDDLRPGRRLNAAASLVPSPPPVN